MLLHDVTLSVYPHWASLKNTPGHGGNLYSIGLPRRLGWNRTYDLWNTSPIINALLTELRSLTK